MLENISKYRLITLNILTFALIFSFVLGYTELSSGQSMIKIVLQFMIISLTIFKVNFKNYSWSFWIIGIVVILPLFLLIIGEYSLSPERLLLFVIFYLFNYIFTICIADFYQNHLDMYVTIWQIAIASVLTFLFIIYRGINFSVLQHFNAMVSNDRYGNIGLQRAAMGFINVNELGMFSAVLIICCIYQIGKRKFYLFSTLLILLSIVLVFNSESRTPVIAVLFSIVLIGILKVKSKLLRRTMEIFGSLIFLTFTSYFLYLLVKGDMLSDSFQKFDELSSYRLTYGVQALNIVKHLGSPWLGLGPMQSSYINGNLISGNLDNSFEYYIFTLGYIGTILIYMVVMWMVIRLMKYKKTTSFLFFGFYIIYSYFEHAIFSPNSALSFFCLTIIFIFIKGTYNNEKNINSNDTNL